MDLRHIQFQGRSTMRRVFAPSVGPSASGQSQSLQADPVDTSGLPALVLSCAGLDPAAYRAGPLGRRIAACLRAMRVESELAARARLEARPELQAVALSTLLIGVSAFFRDSMVFATLRDRIMPALGQRRGPLRIWSVGCSTGAELYSVAILLAEAGLLHRAILLGTDCRADAVAQARSGLFRHGELDGVDGATRARYFEQIRSGYRIAEEVRGHVTWQVADATYEPAHGPWDLVLCRNVVIYLQNAVADTLFRRIAATIVAGGFLVVGKAERPPAALGLTTVARCVYHRHVD